MRMRGYITQRWPRDLAEAVGGGVCELALDCGDPAPSREKNQGEDRQWRAESDVTFDPPAAASCRLSAFP
jgi:hypothetical protein